MGRIAYLSPCTSARLKEWLNRAGLKCGPLIRGLHTRQVFLGPLATSSVWGRIKVAAKRARLSPDVVAGLSGHSMRVSRCTRHDVGRV